MCVCAYVCQCVWQWNIQDNVLLSHSICVAVTVGGDACAQYMSPLIAAATCVRGQPLDNETFPNGAQVCWDYLFHRHLHTQEQRVQVKYNIYSIQWHTHVHTMHMCVHAHALLYTCIPTYAHTPTWRINENCRIIVSKWNGYCEACREENAFTNQNPQDRWHNDATYAFHMHAWTGYPLALHLLL